MRIPPAGAGRSLCVSRPGPGSGHGEQGAHGGATRLVHQPWRYVLSPLRPCRVSSLPSPQRLPLVPLLLTTPSPGTAGPPPPRIREVHPSGAQSWSPKLHTASSPSPPGLQQEMTPTPSFLNSALPPWMPSVSSLCCSHPCPDPGDSLLQLCSVLVPAGLQSRPDSTQGWAGPG